MPAPPIRKPKYSNADLAAGTRHELEHTKDRKVAKQTAIDHLKQHPTYYRVLPAAEQIMGALENRKPKVRKRRRPAQRPWNPMTDTPWGRR
jgi:hypothetical protein